MILAGFAIGVVAGLAIEDPELVRDYATGGSRPLAPEDPEPGLAGDGELVRPPTLDPGGFSIPVGAFGDAPAARRLAEELEGAGYPVFVVRPDPERGGDRWRVRVGPISTRERAEAVAAELKSERSLPTWVLDDSA